ncbi:MAG: hypothetical protein A2X41_11770 [Candidatus Margulisbacteria bacterium GWE2_39_32]|nr:MAG: hypothetical protein A2X41_11770 [Candidatus Margulisbacteria bacterium GWE2_39_32]
MLKKIIDIHFPILLNKAKTMRIISPDFPRGDETFLTIKDAKLDKENIVFTCEGLSGPIVYAGSYINMLQNETSISNPLYVKAVLPDGNEKYLITVEKPQDMIDNIGINPKTDTYVLSTANLDFSPRRIRAAYDTDKITVYQSFEPDIALEAIHLQTFGRKFDDKRPMTWIKPSLYWMLYRYHNTNQDNEEKQIILKIDIKRSFFYDLLATAALTTIPKNGFYPDTKSHKRALVRNLNRVQWDPDRNSQLYKADSRRAIQIGIYRLFYDEYKKNILSVENATDLYDQLINGKNINNDVPPEYPVPVPEELMKKFDMMDVI